MYSIISKKIVIKSLQNGFFYLLYYIDSDHYKKYKEDKKMAHFCINRSGKNLTVTRVNNGEGVIGTIKPNEVFVWLHEWNGNAGGADSQAIYFQNNGTFENGWINGATAIGGITPLTRCSLYDVDTGYGNGVESVFQTRYAVCRYDASGKYVDTLPANTFLTTKNCTSGETYRKRMHISSYGPDGGDPRQCNSFIDITAAGMQFNSFALKGTLR